jgi:hypothetical protein
MQDQIKPVNGSNKTPLNKHGDLLHDMWRLIRSKAESETDDNDNTPGQFMDKFFHDESIPHMPEVSAMSGEMNKGLKKCLQLL